MAACQRLCGSWNAALRAARLTPGYEAHWSDDHVRRSYRNPTQPDDPTGSTSP